MDYVLCGRGTKIAIKADFNARWSIPRVSNLKFRNLCHKICRETYRLRISEYMYILMEDEKSRHAFFKFSASRG